jgi:catechol 2,3-dioxygenase-like lactoylglutathione lyase family enzyme
MKSHARAALAAFCLITGSAMSTNAQSPLPAPGFHHLALNSVDPEKAIDFYTKVIPSTSRVMWGGQPALSSPNNVLILFNKVASAPTIEPQSALWHFGWHFLDLRATNARIKALPDVKLYPMFSGVGEGMVELSADTYPGTGGVLGLTKTQIAEAQARNDPPGGRPSGFGYMRGPDNVIIEYRGALPQERFDHVHMWQDEVFCAQLWYQKHLNAPALPGRGPGGALTEDNCKVARGPDRTFPAFPKEGMFRTPSAAVVFGDVNLTWYANQGDKPLAPSRGQLYDHIGLSVKDLDAWTAKLRGEGVKFLDGGPVKFGDTRALFIEGPSREALALVEVK